MDIWLHRKLIKLLNWHINYLQFKEVNKLRTVTGSEPLKSMNYMESKSYYRMALKERKEQP